MMKWQTFECNHGITLDAVMWNHIHISNKPVGWEKKKKGEKSKLLIIRIWVKHKARVHPPGIREPCCVVQSLSYQRRGLWKERFPAGVSCGAFISFCAERRDLGRQTLAAVSPPSHWESQPNTLSPLLPNRPHLTGPLSACTTPADRWE